jgi:TPR repeat protein
MTRFYEHVESPEAAAPHQQWLDKIRRDMYSKGDGSREKPYPTMTAIEAQMYAISRDMSPVGSIYQSGEDFAFSLLLQAKPADLPIVSLNFDLSAVYQAERMDLSDGDDNFTPFSLIGMLAKRNDTAAQAAIGAFLATQGRIADAIDWLKASSRRGNLLANSILARIYWEQASTASDEESREAALAEVLENYLHAIALGSSDAMYALGVLYLNEHYGEENQASGITLLTQAAAMDHADAAIFLGHLYYAGEGVERDLERASNYYTQAAELGNASARYSYARFLMDPETTQPTDPRIIDWLEELTDNDDATAMVLLGNLYARGIATNTSTRRAVSYYKKAVKAQPDNATIVNEIVWTLTVSDVDNIRRERYALGIMDKLMANDDIARRRPEYLDTWAAAHAANGNYTRAVSLQEEAIAVAQAEEFADVRDVLETHLQIFKDHQTITEKAP